ncbi:MAG: acyltransferase [Vampirovibrionales bacterium]|nr:acyltransferase [Vampirovibrionales bacterium]
MSRLKKLAITKDNSLKQVYEKVNKMLRLEIDCILTATVLRFTNFLGGSPLINHVVRPAIFRAYGFRFGKKCCFYPGMSIYCKQDEITIGDQTYINENCFFDATGPITIANNCEIGFNVTFITSGHTLQSDFKQTRPCQPMPIVMEQYAWIGAGATIMPGVTIGEGAVVAAGAIVTKSVPPHTLVGGIPAKVMRILRDVPVETSGEAKETESSSITAKIETLPNTQKVS